MTTMTEHIARTRGRGIAPARLVGGIGGFVFVATVIAQNAIRGLSAPANNASAATVAHFYATHRPGTFALAALLPVGAAGLAAFIGALGSRLTASTSRAAALAGILGAAGIFATYTMLMATDLAVAGYVHRGGADSNVVAGLWVTHNAVFGVLLVAIAVTLAALTAAASAAGLVAPAWKRAGALGALALAVSAAAAPALIDGSHILALALAGFLVWIAFVARVAVTLIRQQDPA